MQLAEKKIVVIGGTSGIGRAAADAFVREGAKVVVVGQEEDACAALAEHLGPAGKAFCGDARQPDCARQAIRLCVDTFGGFDGLYHVAGGSGRRWGDGRLHDLTLEAWHQTLDLNLTSVMLSNQAAVRAFMEQNTRGSILNMSSVLATSPSPAHFTTHAYATAKAAVNGFTKTIAAFYAPFDIRVNALAPALIQTPMSERAQQDMDIMAFVRRKQPLAGGRIGHTSDLIGLACYFMSDQSCFTTGQIIAVDGGWSLSEGDTR